VWIDIGGIVDVIESINRPTPREAYELLLFNTSNQPDVARFAYDKSDL
jgi:hypothetical protein